MSVDQRDMYSLASMTENANEASREWRCPSMRRLDLAEAELLLPVPSADGVTGKDKS
jgi:hypothetical protein